MLLRRAILEKMMMMDSVMRDIDNKSRKNGSNLSLLEFRTLQYICTNKKVTPTNLARKFNVTPATVSIQVNRLIEKGHISKVTKKDDKRSINLSLSKECKSRLGELLETRLKLYDPIFKTLTKADEEMLLQIMKKMDIHDK